MIETAGKIKLDQTGFLKGTQSLGSNSAIELAEKIGIPYCPKSYPFVQSLVPSRASVDTCHTYSGVFGLEEFPFHTDLAHWFVPPRYLLLRCVVPDRRVTTPIVHSGIVVEAIGSERLRRARFRPRKRLKEKMFQIRIFSGDCFRWDSIFIEPVSRIGHEVKAEILGLDYRSVSRKIALEQAGEWVLIDNWKVMHARSFVPPGSSRLVERVYLTKLN